jgi:hypothetical protein
MHTFTDFEEWHRAITLRCGLTLSHDYCAERITALQDEAVPSTRNFIDTYGETYRQTVISWFETARRQAT